MDIRSAGSIWPVLLFLGMGVSCFFAAVHHRVVMQAATPADAEEARKRLGRHSAIFGAIGSEVGAALGVGAVGLMHGSPAGDWIAGILVAAICGLSISTGLSIRRSGIRQTIGRRLVLVRRHPVTSGAGALAGLVLGLVLGHDAPAVAAGVLAGVLGSTGWSGGGEIAAERATAAADRAVLAAALGTTVQQLDEIPIRRVAGQIIIGPPLPVQVILAREGLEDRIEAAMPGWTVELSSPTTIVLGPLDDASAMQRAHRAASGGLIEGISPEATELDPGVIDLTGEEW